MDASPRPNLIVRKTEKITTRWAEEIRIRIVKTTNDTFKHRNEIAWFGLANVNDQHWKFDKNKTGWAYI